jgi:hypothetical protein
MQTALIQIDPPKILAIHRKPVRVKGGDVVGVVPGTAIVPVVTLPQPEHDHRVYQCVRLDPVPHADRVEIGWRLDKRSDEEIVQAIKQRAGEVILTRYSQTTQLNMLADSQLIASTAVKTAEMVGRLDAYRAAYDWIKSVRGKSNQLEAALLSDGTLPDFAELEVPFG